MPLIGESLERWLGYIQYFKPHLICYWRTRFNAYYIATWNNFQHWKIATIKFTSTHIYTSEWRQPLWECLTQQHNAIFPARGPFLESPGNFPGPQSHSKISNLTITMITELFYSHVLNVNRCSLHTRGFRGIRFSVFRYRWTKSGFTHRKVSGSIKILQKRDRLRNSWL